MTMFFASERSEWLETDGDGGFASGTIGLIRTRRYHSLLTVAVTPPTGRMTLVNGFDAWLTTSAGRYPLTSQCYQPGVVHPQGVTFVTDFRGEPWPRWSYRFPDGTCLEHELFVRRGGGVYLSWRRSEGQGAARLELRPLMSARDYHHTHHHNDAFRFEAGRCGDTITWHPYNAVPPIVSRANAQYSNEPDWYYNFLYTEERERGLDDTEDLASPGMLSWSLDEGEAFWILSAGSCDSSADSADTVNERFIQARAAERKRRSSFATRFERAADAYVVSRGSGSTIVAGYPWFTDWGRDTFIALRGLCLATNRFADARDILLEWTAHISDGMLPNRFPDLGDAPEYNSVDASLWFIVAAHELMQMVHAGSSALSQQDRSELHAGIDRILDAFARGTRHGIRMDSDGLLAAGEPGIQLTWMDAQAGDRIVTRRTGKPVEIQALWLNALSIGSARNDRWREISGQALRAFRRRFWNARGECLYDVIDVDHVRGTSDDTCRPNQIFAVGGLPLMLLDRRRARQVVNVVEARLLTPMGLRTLAPGEPGYTPRYEGSPIDRDSAYHQGPAWPWLLGAFVEAWLRVRGNTRAARQQARSRFLCQLVTRTSASGHVPELADAEEPFTPRGCPFQAWSLGELIRLDSVLR